MTCKNNYLWNSHHFWTSILSVIVYLIMIMTVPDSQLLITYNYWFLLFTVRKKSMHLFCVLSQLQCLDYTTLALHLRWKYFSYFYFFNIFNNIQLSLMFYAFHINICDCQFLFIFYFPSYFFFFFFQIDFIKRTIKS